MIDQAVILAGGRGMRLQEHTHSIPKALLPVGDRPIIDHIIYHLSRHSIRRLVIAGGYRYADLAASGLAGSKYGVEIELVDSGQDTNTGGRVAAVSKHLADAPFLLCWCDAVSNLDFTAMISQHEQSNALVTLGAVNPPARFGDLTLEGNQVTSYAEKPRQSDRWISGGYFVVEPKVVPMISGPQSSWEFDVLTRLADRGQLAAFRYSGLWQCMDTVHEHALLNSLFHSDQAFWPLAEK